jgi:RNA polymerase sigma-70 factor (ECF subfamily)
MTGPSDAARWLPLARAGSREALGQLLDGCRGYLLVVARQELDPVLSGKAGASDLVQETFLEAQRDFAQFRGTTADELLAWLRHLLRNNVANFARRYRETAKRRIACEMSLDRLTADVPAGVPAPDDQAATRERAATLLAAIDRLPPDYQQVLRLRYEEGKGFEEIGRALDRTPNAARKLWARAVERLQEECDPPGP